MGSAWMERRIVNSQLVTTRHKCETVKSVQPGYGRPGLGRQPSLALAKAICHNIHVTLGVL